MSDAYNGKGPQKPAEPDIFSLFQDDDVPQASAPTSAPAGGRTSVYDAQRPRPAQYQPQASSVSPGVAAARQRAPSPDMGDLFGSPQPAYRQPNAQAAQPARRPAPVQPQQQYRAQPPAQQAQRPAARAPQGNAVPSRQAPAPRAAAGGAGNGGNVPPQSPRGGNGNGAGGGKNTGGGNGNGSGNGGRKVKKSSVFKMVVINLLKAFFVLCCLGLVAGSIFAVSVCNYVVEATENDEDILDLERISGSSTTYIYALNPNNPSAKEENDYIEIQKVVGESNTIWVPFDEIPQMMKDALISTEDKDFLEHDGFSFSRTVFAALNQVFHIRSNTFGASTLDQQLVKNLTGDKVVSEDGDMTAGYMRKLREIYRAWTLNKNYSKDMILEAYMNTMPLSGTIVGVRAGAHEYYYKELDELTLAQCATVVGITNAPTKYNPYINPENCLERRDYVLYMMRQNEKITEAEYQAALAEPLGLYTGQRETGSSQDVNSYFVDEVYRQVTKDLMEQKGYSSGMAHYMFYNSGWKIYTTLDINLQNKMEEVYEKGYGDQTEGYIFPDSVQIEQEVSKDGKVTTEMVHPQSAMVVINYDGELCGVVGGIGEKEVDLDLNRATMSVRQVGSTMKPIAAYALGIDGGYIDYSSMVEDSPVKPGDPPTYDPETNLPINTWPQNYNREGGDGTPMLVADALAKSTNTVAVKVGTLVGTNEMFDFVEETLQVTSLTREGAYTDVDLAPLVLGSMTHGISPYELAGAYQMFGSGGVYTSLHCYTRILDSFDNVVLEPEITRVQAISEESAFVMNRLLSNVLRSSRGTATGVSGTATGMALDYMDSVAKTGTTNDDKDRWFVGLTPYYVTAVWWGYDQPAEMSWPATARTNPPPLAWKEVMTAVQESLPEKSFPEMPAGIRVEIFCRESGLLATGDCPDQQTGYYTSARVPQQCYMHGDNAIPGWDDVAGEGDEAA